MNLLLFFKKLSIILLIFTPLFSLGQIEESLTGTYEVVEGEPIETFIISSDKVEALIDSETVEKFFFYEMEDETYILEKVKLDVTSIDTSIKKDRRLFKVIVTQLNSEKMQLNITHPNGTEQELILSKFE